MSSLEQQLNLLEQVKGAIKHNKNMLGSARDLYSNQVRAMQGAGFLDNYTNELTERNERLSRRTDDVIDELERQLRLMEDFQEAIQRMIEDAKG